MPVVVDNIRLGFATNSSSSHSIIVVTDDMLNGMTDRNDAGYFQWNDFQLVSTYEKLRYVAAQVAVDALFETDLAKESGLAEFFGVDLDGINGVDHQSYIGISNEHTLREYINMAKMKNVIIVGGNDNDDDDEHGVGTYSRFTPRGAVKLGGQWDGKSTKIRQSPDGKYLVAFNPRNGAKVRFRDNVETTEYLKADYPELVDLKITNWCDLGCTFCYQASTTKGKHGDLDDIKKYIDMLADGGCFEVALGGGETTEHPDFIEILKYVHDRGMIVNFTTYTDKWTKNPDILKAVEEYVSAIGVSCHGVGDVELVKSVKESVSWDTKVMAQHVFGSLTFGETASLINKLSESYLGILLLGFKEVGFGKTAERHDLDYQEDEVRVLSGMMITQKRSNISVDTAFVDQHPNMLDYMGVKPVLTTSPEGKFSCYIDAVLNKMGPSSYIEVKDMDTATFDNAEFATLFGKY